ncbi:hypothetical protein SB767_33645, partial [Bacillus sp. SIMBA_069]
QTAHDLNKDELAFSSDQSDPPQADTIEDDDSVMIGSFRMPKKRTIGSSTTTPPPPPKPPIFRKRLTPKKSIQHLLEQKRDEPL